MMGLDLLPIWRGNMVINPFLNQTSFYIVQPPNIQYSTRSLPFFQPWVQDVGLNVEVARWTFPELVQTIFTENLCVQRQKSRFPVHSCCINQSNEMWSLDERRSQPLWCSECIISSNPQHHDDTQTSDFSWTHNKFEAAAVQIKHRLIGRSLAQYFFWRSQHGHRAWWHLGRCSKQLLFQKHCWRLCEHCQILRGTFPWIKHGWLGSPCAWANHQRECLLIKLPKGTSHNASRVPWLTSPWRGQLPAQPAQPAELWSGGRNSWQHQRGNQKSEGHVVKPVGFLLDLWGICRDLWLYQLYTF